MSGRLPKGALKAISLKYNRIFERSVKRYCDSAKSQEEAGILSIDLNSQYYGSDGGNQYKQAHNGGRKMAKNTGSSVDLKVNVDDYDRLKNRLGL